MKQWWRQLQEKEQRLVIVMLVMLTLFAFYHAVWAPINDGLVKETQKLQRHQALLAYVKENTARYQQAQKSSAKQAGGSLTSIVNGVAKSYQVDISRVQPQGDDIQVWIEDIAFNQFLLWLDDLTQNKGLVVKAIDISESTEVGMVKVRRLQLGKM